MMKISVWAWVCCLLALNCKSREESSPKVTNWESVANLADKLGTHKSDYDRLTDVQKQAPWMPTLS